ncbi:DsbA family oxidoreductase [Vibrio ulleungensis]|uniref:DsbA family oxidoreductase n=1 Tax=Vibrio ulleungensis TaxID=2807619 RepID=A0ABS2HBA7_9VIBR|nr:DsbA family oxidoreductase [Vibrio ulleungensis]MBM7034888.1 DsbA family oxidoreductase [Vibrio ulleungensis]
MDGKIKLDIISDVVCPWCIIGYNHLMAAIEELGLQDVVEIEWQPFELNPDMPSEGENLRDHIMRKYGSTEQDSAQARITIAEKGAAYGFDFAFTDDMKMVNTLDAHVLLGYAHSVGKQTELKLRLFSAYFQEQKDVSKREILIAEAVAVGLDKAEIDAQLDHPQGRETVRALESQWHQMGVSGVPTVIFNRTSGLTGAHPQDTYKQVLQELLQA